MIKQLRLALAMLTAALALALPGTAHAFAGAIQASIPDVIGQTVGGMNSGWPVRCLALEDEPSEKALARFDEGAEIGIEAYVAVAARGADVGEAYKRNWGEPWALDGEVTEEREQVKDPWAAQVARLERIGTELGRSEVFGRAMWHAYDEAGALLGTYDAELIRRSGDYAIGRLKLYSPGKLDMAEPLTDYCASPGDHTAYLESRRNYTEERLTSMQEKLGEAEARLASDPDSRRNARRVERRREQVAEREAEHAEAQEAFAKATASDEAAKAAMLAAVG